MASRVQYEIDAQTGDVLTDLFDPRHGNLRWGVATTDHAASSQGFPVVVADDGTAYGPAEIGSVWVDHDDVATADALRRAGYRVRATT